MKYPFVSIVVPTRNEEKNLPRLLNSLSAFDYPKNKLELIIVDGYSTDKTVEIAKKFKAKVYFNRRKIRGAGCKIGLEKARYSLVAFTDADCVVPKNWLEGLITHLKEDKIAAVGGPNITPKNDTPFAKAAGEAVWLLTRAGARYGFSGRKITEIYHNPGCNVIYKKAAILKVGNFNPRLLTCEDEELDFRLRQAGYKLLFTPNVIVDHYRRPTYKKIFIQSHRFAIGRAQAIKLHPTMARWFHFIPSLLLLSAAGLFPALGAFFLFSIYLSLTKKRVPFYAYNLIFLCWFFGWGLGFIKGLLNKK